MLDPALVQIRESLAQVPYIVHINNQNEYERALELMDKLVDNYDTNKQLIELLATSIERWENGTDEFADFNKALACVKPGIAVLKTLMSQYQLGVADLPELGTKSNVSKLLNAAEGKKLTRQHIEALSKRFAVSPALFF
ncbi:helix-turn-helix domain-containing protein [Aeromonas veronii]|uniref:helix-turn-helix domain-containing protein n=1 Tax=Aeromonas veronii TaxID=654 RepID=UPI0018831092|nr:transcriptional regulator [Aeromonas veronii]MBE8735501.1 transcriptional regulator [Aeromonas veronii]MBE8739390.1 transcriptional regulator [Aeromonas veronii]MBE8744159.1 transcriptional regulator [Aeromonas veronii]MBE8765430.1 transcriptional regulator [Aeromonas veronii]MBE8841452.1 transcriptional regulator [Aeromonas veronii]